MNPTLALFDFDKTLVTVDSFQDFARFALRPIERIRRLAASSPAILGFVTGLRSRDVAKEQVFARLFAGFTQGDLEARAQAYARERIPQILKPEAYKTLTQHRSRGHDIRVVSASVDLWLKPWCDLQNVGLICTRSRFMGGQLAPHFASPNCNYAEKAKRVQAELDLSRYKRIFVYGDSKGDQAMLALATHAFYRRFPTEVD